MFVLALAFKTLVPSSVYIKCGRQARTRYIATTYIVQRHCLEECRCLPGLYAFAGCDNVEKTKRLHWGWWSDTWDSETSFSWWVQLQIVMYQMSCFASSRALFRVQLKSGNEACQLWLKVPSLLRRREGEVYSASMSCYKTKDLSLFNLHLYQCIGNGKTWPLQKCPFIQMSF